MPGIFQGDIIIKAAIELGIEDMRKNPWLIDHMLEDLTSSVYLKDKYGQKQIDACKEWLKNNQIDIYMRPRDDRDRLPCVTIEMGPSNEKKDMKHMGDLSPFLKMLLPNQIGKPIPYVVKPFIPSGYDEVTGEVSIDPSVDLSGVTAGMILVNPANGTGFVIQDVLPTGVLIEPAQAVPSSELGILPQYQYFEARIERTYFDETYQVLCHAHGDVQNVIFLWNIVLYSLLRYRQSLLEANGFAESVISNGDVGLNLEFSTEGGERAYTRGIALNGQVQNTWIKAPHRIIESIVLKDTGGLTGAIKIISNLNTPDFMDQTKEAWVTVEDSEDSDDSEDRNE